MAGYSDTRQLIIDTLMGRPAGTEIQPEDHQAFALALNDYIRSVELVAGSGVPVAFAEPDTVPVQPNNGQAVYLSRINTGQSVVFSNFMNENGEPITIEANETEVVLVTLLWNSSYWSYQETRVHVITNTENGYVFRGVAKPDTIPGEVITPSFYIADNSGIYENFNGISLNQGEVAVLFSIDGSFWNKEVINIASKEATDRINGINESGTVDFNTTSTRLKLAISNINILRGERFRIRVYSDSPFNRVGISNSLNWSEETIIFSDAKNDVWYDLEADFDIHNIILYLISADNVNISVSCDLVTQGQLEQLQIKTDNIEDEVSALRDRQGYTVFFPDYPAYLKVFDDVTTVKIKAGTTIKNNGVKLLFAENSSLASRVDVPSGATYTFTTDIHYIQTLNISGDVDYEVFGDLVTQGQLEQLQIKTDNIEDEAVTIEKLSFSTSVNKVNINDRDVAIGYYINISAVTGLSANPTYNTTGFIFVKENTLYAFQTDSSLSEVRFAQFYDNDKQPIGEFFNKVKSGLSPEGARFLRVTYYASDWGRAQVTEGGIPQPYEPYKMVISEDYLSTEKADLEYFFLPKDIYVASGRTIELYYSQILLNYQRYNIKAQCSIGASLERKFQIKGDDAHIGNYPLTIFVYDDNGNVLKSALTTIHIMDASVSNMAILPIGDSLTNGKAWLAEVRNLSNDAISFVGTRKTNYASNAAIRHEGRSGGTCRMYNTDSVPYTYPDNGYGGVGADSETFDSSKSYSKGDFCKYGDDVYVFTSAHSGAWNASHVRNLSQSNPFWDWENNKFSMNHYKSFFSINYNAIMIFLGTNGISLTPETNENGALGIKTLVENIRKEDTTTPIIVVNTIYRSGQNGIGTQGNTDGYTAQSEFKFDADRKVMLLAKAVEDMISGMENVYICPVGFTHDSQYNFGNIKKEVNPRLTDTSTVFELFPLESVHPQLEGYLQMADEMYSTIATL